VAKGMAADPERAQPCVDALLEALFAYAFEDLIADIED
jgi:hypothetical protein